MSKSLYTKLILIIFVLILSLMLVLGVFLMRGIRSFYLEDFYLQMQRVFQNPVMAEDLRKAAAGASPAADMSMILDANSGQLGIYSGSRSYCILSIETGVPLAGNDISSEALPITANILAAMNGEVGWESDSRADYMDVAIPVKSDSGGYIVYIRDNKSTVTELSRQIFIIILNSMIVAVVISIALSLLLARTLVTPIQSLTRAARRVAGGDFTETLADTREKDEIGVLTRTFNDMAGQLHRTLDDLKRSEALRREFVANVSHELRTPITSIRSYAETLLDAPESPEAVRSGFLEVIVNESDRMTKLVQDLLTLSKFDAGAINFDFEYFRTEKALSSVYNAMAMEAQRHGHRFTLDIQPNLPEIYGDRARLEQVLINLISNAIKYTADGGKILFSAGLIKNNDGAVWIKVKDNGIGIPDAEVPRVFERFYRVDKARSRESGGTGLGLSIVAEIISRHGGKIKLESKLGSGTEATLLLPVGGPDYA
jgi:signal transduction histidine kinase